MASISMKFFELIDLAVGVPNANAINVNILHAILQLIASQVGIQNHKVDFEGDDAKKVQKIKEAASGMTEIINYRVADEQETKLTESAATLQKQMQIDAKRPVKMVEFRMLENKVRMMATHVEAITMLPPTDELMEQLRTNPDMKPVSEMVHKVALTKRVSALEEGVDKIASLVERMYKELTSVRVTFQQQFPDIKLDISDPDLPPLPPVGSSLSPTTGVPETKSALLDAVPEMKEMLEGLTYKVDALSTAVGKIHSSF